MAGTFSRIKTWIAEVLTASDLNAEFDNIINNLDPDGIDDASATEGAMQAVADPYPASVSSLATNLRGEFQRTRYLIKQITGEAQWYIDPDVSLATIFSTYTTLADVQANAMNYAVDTGVADAYVVTISPVPAALTVGMVIVVKIINANLTTTPTLNLNGLGAITITRNSGALNAGDLKANGYYLFQYYTTGWNVINPMLMGTASIINGAVTTAKLADGAVTSAKASGLFGTRDTTKVKNTNYLSATDLIISAYAVVESGFDFVEGYSDATATPTTLITKSLISVVGYIVNITFTVKKGDYWKVAFAGAGSANIKVTPIGS